MGTRIFFREAARGFDLQVQPRISRCRKCECQVVSHCHGGDDQDFCVDWMRVTKCFQLCEVVLHGIIPYSYRNVSAGFVRAAFHACVLTVNSAIPNVKRLPSTNGVALSSIR